MPPKKVKAKKTKTSSSVGDAGATTVESSSMFDNVQPIVIEADPVHYVTLDMRLLNWSYLNFKFRTKTSTRLFAIKQQIKKRHGLVTDLKICKGHFAEVNELKHDMLTLAEYNIKGAAEGDPEVVFLIHYDFKPDQHDNPLLLATEQQ